MVRVPFISCALLLAVVACARNNPVDDKAAANAAALPDVKVSAPSTVGEPHRQTQPAQPLPAAAMKIPPTLQGRWGLTPAACLSPGRDPKGLLVVTADELNFYESRAVPSSDVESDGNSISGNFAFNGEGRSWSRYEALNIQRNRLTRTETNPTASFSYAKCT
jgi:hypothetical protein